MKRLTEEIINLCMHNQPDELALGYARYEKLRTLNVRQFAELTKRNLNGESFDGMIDEMINNGNNGDINNE